MTRTRTRTFFARRSTHGRPHMDFFCEAVRGVRVGYASRALLAPFAAHLRRALLGRVVLILTSNRHFSLQGLRPGSRFSLHRLHGYRVGVNTWYRLGRAGVLKVRSGVIQEIGIADPRLIATRHEALRFFMAFS